VIIQVGHSSHRQTRHFDAPIHHHYELKGQKENQVVVDHHDAVGAVRPVD
jgi:UDP-N-acetylmuramyl pentapeptide phosphotransferase/UDP-N-acetylglucosamine-1-phosphate transferase